MIRMATTVTKVRAGLYVALTENAGAFEIERSWDGRGWHVYEQTWDGYRGEWCQTYATKAEAVEAVSRQSA